jgi:lysyl-tRNA synthetase class 2
MSDQHDNPIKAEKRKKLHSLKEKGINPFPYSFDRTGNCEKIKNDFFALQSGEKKRRSSF